MFIVLFHRCFGLMAAVFQTIDTTHNSPQCPHNGTYTEEFVRTLDRAIIHITVDNTVPTALRKTKPCVPPFHKVNKKHFKSKTSNMQREQNFSTFFSLF